MPMFILLKGRVDNMQSLQLTIFELKKQITSLSFLIITVIFIVFSIMQMGEIFHYPVNSNQDITALNKRGGDVKEYLYVDSSEDEIRTSSINYLNKIIAENKIEESDASILKDLSERMEKENLTLDEADNILSKDHSELSPWIKACKNQFSKKVGNVDEVNKNIKNIIDAKGFNSIFSKKYVTYIQLISAFLILPLFLITLTKDTKSDINEIIYVQPISSTKYILCKYASCLISILVMLYIIGASMDLYVTYKFKSIGWNIDYSGFFKYYSVYIIPTILFLSSLITFLVLLLKKSVAILPIYILYVVFNATQSVFLGHSSSNQIYKCIIRLISDTPSSDFIIINRIIYIILSLLLIGFSCVLYKNSRKNSRRAIKL